MNRQGGFIHLHFDRSPANGVITKRSDGPTTPADLAPLELRHAVYSELIRLSPASNFRSLVAGPKGLMERGFSLVDANRFGALPPGKSDRDELCFKLHRFIRGRYSSLRNVQESPLIGIPGFWREPSGRIRLWKKVDYEYPFLVIPYRDAGGRVQACQLRSPGLKIDKRNRYCWLSSASEPNGVGTGDPIHFTSVLCEYPANAPLIITEGALKAETFVSLQSDKFVIATSGIGNSHSSLVAASRNRDLLIAFDSDHSFNPVVAGQLAFLIAERTRDVKEQSVPAVTKIVVWDDRAKGIDDAALLNLTMRTITVDEWYSRLTGNVLKRVKEVWGTTGFQALT